MNTFMFIYFINPSSLTTCNQIYTWIFFFVEMLFFVKVKYQIKVIMFNITSICQHTVSKCHPEVKFKNFKMKSTMVKKSKAIGVDHRQMVSLIFCLRANPLEFNTKLFLTQKFICSSIFCHYIV